MFIVEISHDKTDHKKVSQRVMKTKKSSKNEKQKSKQKRAYCLKAMFLGICRFITQYFCALTDSGGVEFKLVLTEVSCREFSQEMADIC